MPDGLSYDEQKVYLALIKPMRADDIAAACDMPSGEANSILTVMELMGHIEQTDTQIFRRK